MQIFRQKKINYACIFCTFCPFFQQNTLQCVLQIIGVRKFFDEKLTFRLFFLHFSSASGTKKNGSRRCRLFLFYPNNYLKIPFRIILQSHIKTAE